MTTANALLVLAAVGALLFLIHRFAPTSAVAKAEDVVAADAKKAEPGFRSFVSAVELDASSVLAKAELWLTDDSASNAKRAKAMSMIAEADAETATRQAALRAHVAALQAKLPPAPLPNVPPAA